MGTLELKSNLHTLIDGIENTQLLEAIYEMLSDRLLEKTSIWSELSDEEKKEVLEAYNESEEAGSLIPHSEMLKKLQ